MLILNPERVTFGTLRIEHVSALAVDRAPEREVVERGDGGPHITFADVPEQRITITVVQTLERDAPAAPLPGQAGLLSWSAAPGSSDAGRLRASAQAVVLRVRHDLLQRRAATRAITFLAVSADGAADPITVTA